MNEANRKALTDALNETLSELRWTQAGGAVAAKLIERHGVIVPDAVTPGQVKTMDPGISCINGESSLARTDCCEECAKAWRDALKIIARNSEFTLREVIEHAPPQPVDPKDVGAGWWLIDFRMTGEVGAVYVRRNPDIDEGSTILPSSEVRISLAQAGGHIRFLKKLDLEALARMP
jgi:hypothetical protein